jgi:hypothetical protein
MGLAKPADSSTAGALLPHLFSFAMGFEAHSAFPFLWRFP